MFGTAASPLVEGDLVIVPIGGKGKGALAALNKETGDRVWTTTDGDGPGYGSPMAFELGGKKQVVVFSQTALMGVDIADGAALWSLPFTTPYEQNVMTIAKTPDGLLIYSGLQQGVFALRFDAANGGKKPEEAWQNPGHWMYMDSPVIHGDHLYFLSNKNKGALVCLDLATGQTVWETGGRMAAYASIILADGRLIVMTDTGELKVVEAEPDGFKELASYEAAPSTTYAHTALSGGRLFVKDTAHLTAYAFGEGP